LLVGAEAAAELAVVEEVVEEVDDDDDEPVVDDPVEEGDVGVGVDTGGEVGVGVSDGVFSVIPPVIVDPVIGIGSVISVSLPTAAGVGCDTGLGTFTAFPRIVNVGLALPESPITI